MHSKHFQQERSRSEKLNQFCIRFIKSWENANLTKVVRNFEGTIMPERLSKVKRQGVMIVLLLLQCQYQRCHTLQMTILTPLHLTLPNIIVLRDSQPEIIFSLVSSSTNCNHPLPHPLIIVPDQNLQCHYFLRILSMFCCAE